jgi:hypothetical protein
MVLNIAPWKSGLPLIFLVWIVLGWLQIVLADASVGGGFFNGLLNQYVASFSGRTL